MKKITQLVLAAMLLAPVTFAQVRVLMSGGFSAPFHELLPEIEKATGLSVVVSTGPSQGNRPDTIGSQLRRGAAVDMVIMSREGLNELIADSRILPGSDTDLAQSPLGVAVRTGAARPDFRTIESFKEMLLRAKSVALPSTTGVYMASEIFPKLGIAAEMAPKVRAFSVAIPAGAGAEIAIQPVSELLHAPGFDFVGTIPAAIQHVAVFSAALVENSKQPEAARKLIAWLASPAADAAIRNNGMERPKRAR